MIKKQRLSAIELLRLISMFMVLVLHADYAAIGVPDSAGWQTSCSGVIFRVWFEQLSVAAVNVFVLISGWFGIRTSARSVCSFLFQIFFFALLILGVRVAVGIGSDENIISHLSWRYFVPGYHLWFIRDYLGLMILAPVLNSFLDKAPVKTHRLVVMFYLLFEIIFGWLLQVKSFAGGYSLISFIGLYLLGSLARRENLQRFGREIWIVIYISCSLLLTGWTLIIISDGEPLKLPGMINSYNSPIVIIEALALLLAFSGNSTWRSKFVNGMAISAFAVYLVHCNPLLFVYYKLVCNSIFKNFSGLAAVGMIAIFLTAVFMISILADRLRLLLWGCINKYFTQKQHHF